MVYVSSLRYVEGASSPLLGKQGYYWRWRVSNRGRSARIDGWTEPRECLYFIHLCVVFILKKFPKTASEY